MSEVKKSIEKAEQEIAARAAEVKAGTGEIKASMTLELKPDHAKGTTSLSLVADDLSIGDAQHLMQHLQEGVDQWMECVDARGFATTVVGDKDGNVIEEGTTRFGDSSGTGDFSKLPATYDPKKVN